MKVVHAVRNSETLGYGAKASTYKITMNRLKSMFVFFFQLALLSNNFVLASYLSGIYLESRFSWLCGEMQRTLKKRRKQIEEKH